MSLDMPASLPFISGLICMGYIVASLFFARFWRRTGDDLFAAFAAAFLLLVPTRLWSSSLTSRGRKWAGSTCCAWRPSP